MNYLFSRIDLAMLWWLAIGLHLGWTPVCDNRDVAQLLLWGCVTLGRGENWGIGDELQEKKKKLDGWAVESRREENQK